jgi:hypothetical protein
LRAKRYPNSPHVVLEPPEAGSATPLVAAKSPTNIGQHGSKRVAKAVLMSAVTPWMVKVEGNPGGVPIEVLDVVRNGMLADRSQFFKDFAGGPFFSYNRPGAKASSTRGGCKAIMGGFKNLYECVKAFLGNEPHRGPQEVRCADLDHPRGRRSGGAGCVATLMCCDFVVEPNIGVDDWKFSSSPRTDRE